MANNIELQQQNTTQLSQNTSSDKENQQQQTAPSQSSLSNSVSLIKLDEISSFGATKQGRLPALIRVDKKQMRSSIQEVERQVRSMPVYSADQLETAKPSSEQAKNSLPLNSTGENSDNKQQEILDGNLDSAELDSLSGGFQMVDMDSDGLLIGPSLPPIPIEKQQQQQQAHKSVNFKSHSEPLAAGPATSNAMNQQNSMQLGDSLIDMVVNLRNENQNLLQALQRNNDYVRQRLDEFKLQSEQTQIREQAFAKEKADLEHETRKLKRQNGVLSERLKSMEAKLKDMKLEVSDSLAVAQSSRASSDRADFDASLYPQLEAPETLQMQVDCANEELNAMDTSDEEPAPAASRERASQSRLSSNIDVSKMTKEELGKHFDADKVAFYSMGDRLKQCDKLEQQLNEIGQRDYEICLLQQQLNIYRQDFRLERMANLEAKIQIEKLKQEIDDLCLKRIQEKITSSQQDAPTEPKERLPLFKGSTERFMGRVGKKAARSAAKAAKYAAKHAHLEEKAQAAAAALAARYQQATGTPSANANSSANCGQEQQHASDSNDNNNHHHHRHHRRSHHHRSASGSAHQTGASGIKSEVVSDLWETANKAMRTGYKMASTHVNLALDKLTEFEQAQAASLAKNKQQAKASAPPMTQHDDLD